MSSYLLIESRDPFDSRDSATFLLTTANELAGAGHKVTVFLIQNGALIARREAVYPPLSAAVRAGVEVLADEFSLSERGIRNGEIAPGVRAASIGTVIERLISGDRVIWH